jgi:photosystem II stability/assembly factor-like uncharacterized protein
LAFNLTSVWDGGPAGAFIGGVVGLTVGFRPGSATLLSYNITYNAVAGGAGAIYATDDLGDVYRFNGTTWTVPANESGLRMYSVSPPFAVGDFGGILQEAADKTWAMVPTPYPLFEGPRLYSVAARSATDAIAVGNGGMILKLTTPGWSVQPSATTAGLRGVWYSADGKTAYAVGQSGTILRYDGTSWAQMTSPVTATLLSVWSPARDTAAPNVVPNVYAAADDGSILVNTAGGATWTVMRSPTSVALTSLWGISATEIYAAGDQGTLLRFDGTSWSSMQSGVTASLTAIGGATGIGAFVLGRAGTALYGAPASSLHSAAATTIRRRVTITREIPSNVVYPDRASSTERGSTVPRTPR